MDLIKLGWAIRGVFNKPFFKQFGNMSYLGKPIIIHGKDKISIGNKVRIYPNIRLEVLGGGVPYRSRIIHQLGRTSI